MDQETAVNSAVGLDIEVFRKGPAELDKVRIIAYEAGILPDVEKRVYS